MKENIKKKYITNYLVFYSNAFKRVKRTNALIASSYYE
jgi:hypothetical protein